MGLPSLFTTDVDASGLKTLLCILYVIALHQEAPSCPVIFEFCWQLTTDDVHLYADKRIARTLIPSCSVIVIVFLDSL